MTDNKCFVFRFDDVEVRDREFVLTKAGEVLPIEPKAFRVLQYLLRNPQKLVTKDELLDAVWSDVSVSENSVARAVAQLRRLLGDDLRQPRYIATVPTVGYRFVCNVEVQEDGNGKVDVLEDTLATQQSGCEPEGRDRVALIGTTSVREGVVAPTDFPLQSNDVTETEKKRTQRPGGIPRTLWRWLLLGGVVFAAILVSLVSYVRLRLPPLRVTGYNPITHDGAPKIPVGSDGTRLYFNLKDPPSIGQVGLWGGEPAPVALAVPGIPHPFLLDLSPDGSSFLVVPEYRSYPFGDMPIWNVRTPGDVVRRLGSGADAAFSPDGKSVAYSKEPGEIWVVRSDGSDAHKLASVGGVAFNLTWSPDGATIRFTASLATDQNLLWEISSNGSNLHPVLPSGKVSARKWCGRWTPDGKFFVFLVAPRGLIAPRPEIWALDERRGIFRRPSTEPFQLTSGPIRWDHPVPSKDGKTIYAEGVIVRGELSRFDSGTHQFKPFLGGISAQGATFSRDGKVVAYVSYPEGTLWKANADGSGAVQLTDPPMEVFMPRWSPDGTQIVFTGSVVQDSANYIVSSEGGSPRRVVPDDHTFEMHSDWSPDGHKIVFVSLSSPQSAVVRIVDLASRGVTTLPGSVGKWGPRWSPDGRYLVAVATDEHKLTIFDFNTQQWSTLAQNGNFAAPQWSHDGRYIYFRQPVNDRGVFRIPLTGGKAERVVDLKDWHDAGWLGRYFGLDPTDAPLLLRDIGSADIYSLSLDVR